jgi:hypothetical protein
MKTLIAVAALAAVIASPALARPAHHQSGEAVISGDRYLGSDPDANVRFDLQREAGSRNGGY